MKTLVGQVDILETMTPLKSTLFSPVFPELWAIRSRF